MTEPKHVPAPFRRMACLRRAIVVAFLAPWACGAATPGPASTSPDGPAATSAAPGATRPAATRFGDAKPAIPQPVPRISHWQGPDDPLARKLIAWFKSRDPMDAGAVGRSFDTERGFLWLPEDRERPVTDPALIGRGIESVAKVLLGWEGINEIIDLRRLDGDHVALLTRTRAIQYMNPAARSRPAYYVDFRTSWVLREVPDGFRIVYQVEAPVSPLTYLWRFHEQMGKEFQDELARESAAGR